MFTGGKCHAEFQSSTLYNFLWKPVTYFCSRTILKQSMKPLMKDDLVHTACALSFFTLFSMNVSAQDSAPVNPAEPNEHNGQMTMSLSIPFSQPEQSAPKDDKTPQMLSAKEQEIDELNVQIGQMQALIKNLQASLKQAPGASSAVPTAASSVPAKVSTVPATASAVPAIPAISLAKGLQSKIWILLLLAAAIILWLFKNKAAKNHGIFEDTDEEAWSHAGANSIKTPAYVENQNDAADSTSKGIASSLSASQLHRKHVIEPAEVDSMIEEAELYAIHGHLNNAMEILNNIILQYPERIEVWLLLLSIFRGNARQFEVIARKLLQTLGRNETWSEVQEAGRSIDPENPLYFDPNAPHIKPNKRRLLGNILVDMQALSGNDLENSLRRFDHLRDGRLGRYLVESELINQSQLDEALQIQHKESPKSQPAAKKLLASLGRPRSISDVLVRMGAVTEPELEHVLADFDPKRHGHCGNYLVSCGLITQKQLYSALLQQLSGVMEDAETGQDHVAQRA